MIRGTLTLVVALALMAGVGWQLRAVEPAATWLRSADSAASGRAHDPGPPAKAMRKCRQGPRVLYTDGWCTAGSREDTVRDDRVTVVSAGPAPAAPRAGDATSRPTVRDLLGKLDDGATQDKRMEQVIGR